MSQHHYKNQNQIVSDRIGADTDLLVGWSITMLTPRKAKRYESIEPEPPTQTTKRVSLQLYISTVIFLVVLSCLQFAALVSVLSFMFRTPQTPAAQTVTKVVTATPIMIITATPEPEITATSLPSIVSQPITTTMFGWFDSSYNDYSFFLNDNLVSGQLYALCWVGRYIDGDKLTLPVQQFDLSGSGACILAEALPVDKQYKLGFISQAVRKALLGQRDNWPILELSIYELPIGKQQLPYPTIRPAIGE